MNLNRLTLAVLLAAPIVANAGVTVTPFVGYHSYADSEVNQRFATAHSVDYKKNGVALYSDFAFGGAVGVELTPTLTFEADYLANQSKAATRTHTATTGRYDASHQILSGNFLIGTDMFGSDTLKPYVLVGAGHSLIYAKPLAGVGVTNRRDNNLKTNDTVANLGLGAMYRINDHLAIRGEGRAIRNIDNDWWETVALAGLQITLGNHLDAKVAPVVAVMPEVVTPVVPEPVVEVPKVIAPIDSDNDGVIDADDKCPNTPANVVVDATGCPKVVSAPLTKELRVFFDTNKSNIKAQFKPEVKKVADVLTQNAGTTAKLEGHTDNTGPRSLNDRLSLARANAVKTMMVKEFGVAPTRLTTEGFADTRPVAPNTTEEGRAMNRRVYAVVTGK